MKCKIFRKKCLLVEALSVTIHQLLWKEKQGLASRFPFRVFVVIGIMAKALVAE